MNNSDIEKEARKYDLPSLVLLQEKRKQNVALFEQSIKNERLALQQEELVELNLQNKLIQHNSRQVKLPDAEREFILQDLPKIASTRTKRNETIQLLKAAIMGEYDLMDNEEKMIHFLQRK